MSVWKTSTDEQRGRALGLMAATISAGGFQTAHDVIKLNETVMEMTGKPDEFGEWFYWRQLLRSSIAEQSLGLADRWTPPQHQLPCAR